MRCAIALTLGALAVGAALARAAGPGALAGMWPPAGSQAAAGIGSLAEAGAGAPDDGARPLASGDHRLHLDHDGRQRSYLVHVPPRAAAGKPLPVVLSFHGGGGSAAGHQRFSRTDAVADREGFLAVYPDGTGRFEDRLLTWNAGTCCGRSVVEQVDDVGFALAVLDHLAARAAVDPARVYATGMSNGSMMAYRLAAEAADRIAAVAGVAGSMVLVRFSPSRPVPVLHIHSVDDPRALYGGGLGPPFPLSGVRVLHPAVEEMLARWTAADGCPETPGVEPTLHGRPDTAAAGHTATRLTWAPCREGSEVAHWKLTGAGHVWPGGPRDLPRLLGAASDVIDADEEIWRFFARYRLQVAAN
jgi:polyhydroxybutyrate depolymerase